MNKNKPKIIGGLGTSNPNAVLNENQVVIIRHLNTKYKLPVKKLRRLFPQIGQTQMYNIVNGVYWLDIE